MFSLLFYYSCSIPMIRTVSQGIFFSCSTHPFDGHLSNVDRLNIKSTCPLDVEKSKDIRYSSSHRILSHDTVLLGFAMVSLLKQNFFIFLEGILII